MPDHPACIESRNVVEDLLTALNAHDLERTEALLSPDYEGTDVAEAHPQCGPEGLSNSLRRYFEAFPDLAFDEGETLLDHDRAAVTWTARGTHTGRLLGIPPTGRSVSFRGVTLLTVRAGKIQRGLFIWDLAGLLRSLRLLPEL